MYELEKDVRLAWQLVAQFVSWDFCRYACQQSETAAPAIDVLTFLRNMFVERTEKSISEVTKHEIIAKFILEIKAVKTTARLSCISALSETVLRICPELKVAVYKVLHHLESMLNILDSSQECQSPELVHLRIEDAVSDFTKEANKSLPPPELLKVIEPLVHKHSFHKERRKSTCKPFLFEKVIHCLQRESITVMEAKLIAVALCDDIVLKQMVLHGESETETEAESESFSLSIQSSQPADQLFSQEGSQPTELNVSNNHKHQTEMAEKNILSSPLKQRCFSNDVPHRDSHHCPELQPQAYESHKEQQFDDSLHFTLDSQDYGEPPLLSRSEFPMRSTLSHVNRRNLRILSDESDCEGLQPPQNYELNLDKRPQRHNIEISSVVSKAQVTDECLQFAQSSCSDSEDVDSMLQSRIQVIRKEPTCRILAVVDSDGSDCDINNDFRFLTPTLYKENNQTQTQKPETVWLSDMESNDSSIISTVIDSQKNDPVWNQDISLAPRPAKRKRIASKRKKKTARTSPRNLHKSPPSSKQRTRLFTGLHNYFSPNSAENYPVRRASNINQIQTIPEMAEEIEITTEAPPTRANEIIRKRRNVLPSSKNKKCKDCNKTYKSLIAFKRHMFLKHPLPDPDDSD